MTCIKQGPEELKNIGNELFKRKKFAEAVDNYAAALEFPQIDAKTKSVLYQNTAAAFDNIVSMSFV